MTAIIIGIVSGLITIFGITLLKRLSKPVMYGLILSGIGFLYVGFTWTHTQALITNSIQVILFVMLAYFGMKKNIYILIAGYFLHGCWDLIYDLFPAPDLRPPHYDLFCLSIDFTIGLYLLLLKYRNLVTDETVH